MKESNTVIGTRNIAIHLPQFHPIPENDKWWGKGFTEWTNVTKAKPLFKGHYQPHLPSDLGFYDLRLPETREAQADLARSHGIDGFCYYHYWFNGKMVLEKPVQQILTSGKPDFPFMLCWANENWTRAWDGEDREILLKQDYSDSDDMAHMEFLIPFFKDDRYIKVDGKPVFILYKPFLLPDASATAARWREVAAKHGIELYLCHMVFGRDDTRGIYKNFDAVIDFEPFGIRRSTSRIYKRPLSYFMRLKYVFVGLLNNIFPRRKYVSNYESMYENIKPLSEFDLKIYPSLCPGWDNSPRRIKNPTLILKNSTPDKFGKWLKKIVEDFKPYSKNENFIFINAWNEWAEGNHLEPDQKWGDQYLKTFKQIIKSRHD